MIDSVKADFVKQLVGLAAVKPGKGLTPEGIEIWWNSMQHWAIEEFKHAAAHLARTIEFMPSPFHFEQLRKAGRPQAAEAWIVVLECARKGLELPADPVLQAAVASLGGIRAVAMSETDKTHFLEKRFCDHFESIQDVRDTRESVPQIAGPDCSPKLPGLMRPTALLAQWQKPGPA